MERIRVASPQYFIRPVQTFEQFRDQVSALAAVIEWLNPEVATPENHSRQQNRFRTQFP